MEEKQYIEIKQENQTIRNQYTKTDLEKMKKRLSRASTTGFFFAAVIAALLVVPNFRITFTTSGSMVPTVSVGDFALFGRVGDIERGDITMFEAMGPVQEKTSILTGLSGDVFYEKRVIGMPGEYIRIEDGVVYINNKPLDEPYKVFSSEEQGGSSRNMDEMMIPAEHYFVMGDNRDHSNDSRFFGPIPYEDIRFSAIFYAPSLAGMITGANNDERFIDC